MDDCPKDGGGLELPTMATVKAEHLLLALVLQAQGRQTASTLREWTRMHERTVSRHAKDLRQVGVRVRSIRGAHGGFELGPGGRLHLQLFIGHVTHPDELYLRWDLRPLLENLPVEVRIGVQDVLDQIVQAQVPAGVPEALHPQLIVLRRALWGWWRVSAQIRHAPHEEPVRRELDPVLLCCLNETWYLAGVLLEPRSPFLHELGQIEDVRLLDQPAGLPDILITRYPAW